MSLMASSSERLLLTASLKYGSVLLGNILTSTATSFSSSSGNWSAVGAGPVGGAAEKDNTQMNNL